jgi:hypothetical protein
MKFGVEFEISSVRMFVNRRCISRDESGGELLLIVVAHTMFTYFVQ